MAKERGGDAGLRVALGQYDTGWHDAAASLASAALVIARAASSGAGLVMLPEMSTTGFTMDSARQAETLDGRSVTEFRRLAAQHGIGVLAGFASREPTGDFFNSALLIDAKGDIIAHYRKQRLFALGGEHASYRAGTSATIATVHGVRVAVLICYDLRFADLFVSVAPDIDAILLIANWPVARRAHWDVLVRARAIECQCYVAAVNRVGTAGGADYNGGSVIYDPWGTLLCDAGDTDAASDGAVAITALLHAAEVKRVRERFPFLVDHPRP